MRPGGWGIMLSPVNMERETTYEDPSITDPAERERHFGQKDHLRDYGRDYGRRLSEAGFDVEEIDYVRSLSPEAGSSCTGCAARSSMSSANLPDGRAGIEFSPLAVTGVCDETLFRVLS